MEPCTLAMFVTDHVCERCGHEWTHSYPVLRVAPNEFGFCANNPGEVKRLKAAGVDFTCVMHLRSLEEACHRCIPHDLHQGWTATNTIPKSPSLSPKRKAVMSLTDLEKELS